MQNKDLMEYVPDVEFRLVPINILNTNVAYQRKRSEQFVKKVIDDFDKNLLKVVRCSERDGNLYVWDGQHTIQIVKQVSGQENAMVWCMIYKDLSYEEEAELFSKQQKYFKALQPYNITNARLEAKDEDTIMMERILISYGYSFSDKTEDYRINATKTVENIFYNYGPEVLSRTLSLIRLTWNGKKDYLKSSIMMAIARFVTYYDDDFNDDAFVNCFRIITREDILFETKNCSPRNRMDYLRALVNLYNSKNRRKLNLKKLMKN